MTTATMDLDRVFHALADGGRRQILEQLTRRPSTVSELAAPLPMSLSAVLQHVKVLESAGLVATQRQGKARVCRMTPSALAAANRWISAREQDWQQALDRLETLLAEDDD